MTEKTLKTKIILGEVETNSDTKKHTAKSDVRNGRERKERYPVELHMTNEWHHMNSRLLSVATQWKRTDWQEQVSEQVSLNTFHNVNNLWSGLEKLEMPVEHTDDPLFIPCVTQPGCWSSSSRSGPTSVRLASERVFPPCKHNILSENTHHILWNWQLSGTRQLTDEGRLQHSGLTGSQANELHWGRK